MTDTPAPIKRPRGRPRKVVVEREAKREPISSRYQMKAKPNWETVDPLAEDSPDRLHIDPSLIPDGMSAMWVTDSVFGQGVPQHRARFEKGGWTPVHQSDFDGRFDGMFMPKGVDGEIAVEGMVLMMRPKELTDKAKARDRQKAREQVAIKEQAWKQGDLGTTLDARHPSAVNSNKISRTVERIAVPED